MAVVCPIRGCRVDRRLALFGAGAGVGAGPGGLLRGRKLELTTPEATRLAQHRRQMLARVYAERARQAHNQQHWGAVAEVARLTRENTALQIRVAEPEQLVACSGRTACR